MNDEARMAVAEEFARIMERRHPGTKWAPFIRRSGPPAAKVTVTRWRNGKRID